MNKKELAQKLGISRSTLDRRMNESPLKEELLKAGRAEKHAKVIMPKEQEIIKNHLGDYGKKD